MSKLNEESIRRESENLKKNILDGVQNINDLIENMNKMQVEFAKMKSDVVQIRTQYEYLIRQEKSKYDAMNLRIDNLLESVGQSNITKDAQLREMLKELIKNDRILLFNTQESIDQVNARIFNLEKRTGLR